MNCRIAKQQLDDYLDGTLSDDARLGFENHVAACASCAGLLRQSRAMLESLAALPVSDPTPGFFDRALAQAVEQPEQRRRPARAGWLAAGLAAGLSALVVASLLLSEPAPDAARFADAQLELTIDEPRTFNLVFASNEALEDVSLTIDLPPGIELLGHPMRRQVRWTTQLQAGKNVLPLELVGTDGSGGQIVATLQRDDKRKVFNIAVQLLAG